MSEFLTSSKGVLAAARSNTQEDLSNRVQEFDNRWKELQAKVKALKEKFAEALKNYNSFRGNVTNKIIAFIDY